VGIGHTWRLWQAASGRSVATIAAVSSTTSHPRTRQSQPTEVAAPIGRSSEFAQLCDLLLADTPHACVAEVVGEAGIGKSHLLEAVAAVADQAGIAVLRGRAAEFERDVPFALFLDALAGLDHPLDSAEPEHRHALHGAVRELLETQAQRRPLLVVLDDLHWADGASVDLIRALAARPPAGRILIVVAHRPHQVGSPLRTAALAGVGPHATARIALRGLAIDDAARLLPELTSAAQVAAAHAQCAGNPFVLLQLGRETRPGGGVAPTVSELLASELAALEPAARRLLDAGAVVGDPFELDLAGAVAELDATATLHALDALVAADAVRPTSEARRFSFRHPLIRHCAYEMASPGWRLTAHERAASVLAERGAGPLAIAHHVERCARPGDAQAIATLTAAGHQTAARSPRSAAHWFGAAWALVPEAEHLDPAHVDLLYAFGLALTVSGEGEQVMQLRSPLIEALPATDPVRFRFELGRVSVLETSGRSAAARERLRMLEAAVGTDAHMERLMIAALLATLESDRGDAEAAVEQADRAYEIAGRVGIAELPAMVQALRAWTLLRAGNYADAGAASEEAAAIVDALHAAALDPTPSLLGALAGSELFPGLVVALVRAEWGIGRVAEAARHVDHGLHATRLGKWPILATVLLAHGAMAALQLGRLAEAEELAAAAEEEAAMIDNREADYWAAYGRSALAEPTTRTHEAVEAAERALAAARRTDRAPQTGEAALLLARALVGDGLAGRAIEALERAGVAYAGCEAERCRVLAEAWLVRGDAAQARRWADRAAGASPGSVHAVAADAACAIVEGDGVRAAAIAASAAAGAAARGAVLEAARLELLAGRAYTAAGERTLAASTLRSAEARFAAVAADRLQAEAVRALRELGLRVVRSARAAAPLEPLTGRQDEIARLVAAGRSNREIAEALFLSVKTVETHVAAVFVKLGVANRRELREQPELLDG
jgi:DNA-binding NarL/FixJ family response regulator